MMCYTFKTRSVGAAGAQVPYKHKVIGSNPIPTTIHTRLSASGSLFYLIKIHVEGFESITYHLSLASLQVQGCSKPCV